MSHQVTDTNLAAALEALTGCQQHISDAYIAAMLATAHLTGARNTRACELCAKIADVMTHLQRLAFIVTGDLHAEEA